MGEEVLDCHRVRIQKGGPGEARMLVVEHGCTSRPLTEPIAGSEIIINGTYQDTANPFMYVNEVEFSCLQPGSLVIDVSCDEGMGFFFAKPITFREPMFKVGRVDCCAVDHTPNFLWESASRLISAARVAYMDVVLGGPAQWTAGVTIRRAINTDAGVVQKPHILLLLGRSLVFAHETMPKLPLAA